jgi:hypothetical protein
MASKQQSRSHATNKQHTKRGKEIRVFTIEHKIRPATKNKATGEADFFQDFFPKTESVLISYLRDS